MNLAIVSPAGVNCRIPAAVAYKSIDDHHRPGRLDALLQGFGEIMDIFVQKKTEHEENGIQGIQIQAQIFREKMVVKPNRVPDDPDDPQEGTSLHFLGKSELFRFRDGSCLLMIGFDQFISFGIIGDGLGVSGNQKTGHEEQDGDKGRRSERLQPESKWWWIKASAPWSFPKSDRASRTARGRWRKARTARPSGRRTRQPMST